MRVGAYIHPPPGIHAGRYQGSPPPHGFPLPWLNADHQRPAAVIKEVRVGALFSTNICIYTTNFSFLYRLTYTLYKYRLYKLCMLYSLHYLPEFMPFCPQFANIFHILLCYNSGFSISGSSSAALCLSAICCAVWCGMPSCCAVCTGAVSAIP